jgi:hypothetical protein
MAVETMKVNIHYSRNSASLAARGKTGYFCSYNPHPDRPVTWKFYFFDRFPSCDPESHNVTRKVTPKEWAQL